MKVFCWALPAVLLLILGAGSAMGAGDAEKGRVVFEKCAACHSLEPGKDDNAPTLAGIFGRKAASEDFRYSAAMKRSDVTWNEKSLDSFLEDPQAFIPGNRMPFEGLKDKSDRENLLEYLKETTKQSSSKAP